MTAGSLFTGIGGLDIAVEQALHAKPAWMCEVDPHARLVLERHYPDVPVLHDVRELDDGTPRVDILHGGYPCQPFSSAGKRQGADDERHLWPEFARLVRLLRPRRVVLENVSNHLVLGFDAVLGSLAEMGYDTRWGSVRASDAGAPHRRERVFAVATNPQIPERGTTEQQSVGTPRGRATELRERVGGDSPDRWGRYARAIWRWESVLGRSAPAPADTDLGLSPEFVEWMMGFPEGWTAGADRLERLRMLGNAVVPQQGRLALELLVTA